MNSEPAETGPKFPGAAMGEVRANAVLDEAGP
jgi:hypothetical protein